MSKLSQGYFTDLDYTLGYYAELSPDEIHFNCALRGLVPPKIKNVCEIGFGMGVSLCLHAAISDARWYGIELNSRQASWAEDVRLAAQIDNLTIIDKPLDEADAEQLPIFDLIIVHGIVSWVSPDVIRSIFEFIRKRLALRGIVYVSYNLKSGWKDIAPLRPLFLKYFRGLDRANSSVSENIKQATSMLSHLVEHSAVTKKVSPNLIHKLGSIFKGPPEYLAHEFLNDTWTLYDFIELNELFEGVGLSHCINPAYLDRLEALHLSSEQREFISRCKDEVIRQSCFDLMTNQQFRRDYFVRGELAKENYPLEKSTLHIVKVKDFGADVIRYDGQVAYLSVNSRIIQYLEEKLELFVPYSLSSLASQIRQDLNVQETVLIQSLLILKEKGFLRPCNDPVESRRFQARANIVNQHLIKKAYISKGPAYLISPLTRVALRVDLIEVLLCYCKFLLKVSDDQVGSAAARLVSENGLTIRKEDRTLSGKELDIEVTVKATNFLNNTLPRLMKLGMFTEK